MTDMTIKPRVLELLSFAHEHERKLFDSLTDVERAQSGSPDHWSPKERLVSIARWKQLQTEKLAQAVRGETPPEWREEAVIDPINAEAFARYRDTPFDAIDQVAEEAYCGLVAQVTKLSEEELSDTEKYPWAEGAALWQETLGNGLWYPFSQMMALALERNDREGAARLQALLLDVTREVALPDMLGIALYNAACFYALHSWEEKALTLLPEALRLRPTLLELSRHDSDLDSLRGDPRFRAILDDPALAAAAPVTDLVAPHALAESTTSAGAPMIIDVRGPSEYAAGHVAGAVNIPLGQLPKHMKSIPQEQQIVTYCNMHHRGESRGERAAAMLRERGYKARALDGGYPAWSELGLPTG
jgi:rhodanese-related sulfurtransferase